jgi:predicted rRNA methylase YqxC with S4 and FtsJ domains
LNLKLKARIIEKYGSQVDFSEAIKIDETLVSKVVRGRRKLKPAIQRLWADALQCKPKDIFADEI